jgi:hypothetical protein
LKAVFSPAYQAPTAIKIIMAKIETPTIVAGTEYHSGVVIVASQAVVLKAFRPFGFTTTVKALTL